MTTSFRIFYVSYQRKLYKNTQYVTIINKRLFNVAPNKYGKLVCVYDSSPQNVLTREDFLDSHELRDVKAQSSTSHGSEPRPQSCSPVLFQPAFAGHTYHIVGNLMSWLKYSLHFR